MKLSIVSAGRNDDYGGNFAERVLITARRNQIEAHHFGIDCEWIFVEWNPLDDDWLSYRLADLGFQCFVVSPEIHRLKVDASTRMTFMQFHACNAGIRRAAGGYVLSTHPDDIIGPDVWGFLASGQLNPKMLYRAQRFDIAPEWFGASFELMNESRGLDHGRGPTNAAGDFLLFSAQYKQGFDEAVNFSDIHLDGRFVRNWVARQGGDELDSRFWQFIGTIYKADHPMIYRRTHRIENHHRGQKSWDAKQKTCSGAGLYKNHPNWGLMDEPQRQICENVWYIGVD